MKKFTTLITVLASLSLNSIVIAQWQYDGNDIYYDEGKVSIGNSPTERFTFEQSGTAHISRQTGGYNLTIENTSFESSKDYGAALFKAPNGVNAIKAEGRVVLTGDLVLISPDGSGWNLKVDNDGNLSIVPISLPNKTEEIYSDCEVNIFPNPTNDLLNVTVDDQTIKMVDIEIYDLTGKMIFMKNYKSGSFKINIEDMDSGTYLLKLKDHEGNLLKTQKIIKL